MRRDGWRDEWARHGRADGVAGRERGGHRSQTAPVARLFPPVARDGLAKAIAQAIAE